MKTKSMEILGNLEKRGFAIANSALRPGSLETEPRLRGLAVPYLVRVHPHLPQMR